MSVSVIRNFFNIPRANNQLCQESLFTAAGKYFGHWKKRKNGSKTRLCLLLACGPGSDAEQYTESSRSLTKAEQTQNLQSNRICTWCHRMTQVDKRGLYYPVLGLMVLVLFSGFGDANETSDDVLQVNTTQAVDSEEQPRILAVQTPCGPEHEGFCFNGVCTYSSELDTPICRCRKAYSGVRCEHLVLDSQGSSRREELIGISCGVALLLGAIIVLMLFCLKKRCRKSSPPYKNYGSENFI